MENVDLGVFLIDRNNSIAGTVDPTFVKDVFKMSSFNFSARSKNKK